LILNHFALVSIGAVGVVDVVGVVGVVPNCRYPRNIYTDIILTLLRTPRLLLLLRCLVFFMFYNLRLTLDRF